MKALTTFLTGATLCSNLFAQGVITRMNAGQHYFRYDGNLAAVIAEADLDFGTDTIIMGGGTYTLPADILVSSPIVFIGSGFRADSSAAYNGGRTLITTTSSYRYFRFSDAADGSEMHGLSLRGSIEVQLGQNVGNSAVDGFRVRRCDMDMLRLGPSQFGSNASNAIVEESVIDNLDLHQSANPLVRSCFIKSLDGGIAASNATVENCIFLGWTVNGNTNVTYRNCVFARNVNTPITIIDPAHKYYIFGTICGSC